jgi:hypothetical protein
VVKWWKWENKLNLEDQGSLPTPGNLFFLKKLYKIFNGEWYTVHKYWISIKYHQFESLIQDFYADDDFHIFSVGIEKETLQWNAIKALFRSPPSQHTPHANYDCN